MSAISGFNGLKPTIKIIKKITDSNSQQRIYNLWMEFDKKQINKYKTKFIPVDSEHFSIWSVIKNLDPKTIDQIVITVLQEVLFLS